MPQLFPTTLPVANAAAVVVESSPGTANLSAIDITTGVEPVGCLCPKSCAHPHPGYNAAWTKGGYGGRGTPGAPAGARSTYCTATNATQPCWPTRLAATTTARGAVCEARTTVPAAGPCGPYLGKLQGADAKSGAGTPWCGSMAQCRGAGAAGGAVGNVR